MDDQLPRRSIIKGAGIGLVSLTAMGTAQADTESNDSSSKQENDSDDISVSPEYINNATTSFSPSTISSGDSSTLRSEWYLNGTDIYQLDILVESDKISKPTVISKNVGGVDKFFEYRSNSPVGPAYHFKARSLFTASGGKLYYVEAEIDPYDTGIVTADTGTYWPTEDWVPGNLRVE
ncbi:hypothetical protein [Halalkalicoccus subterraneus]|uniref:hypothetical protein n=1 Tax=Halalkalicoccus subterraneus TaxID=2675002 RepID=UPI0013CE8C51|nr:hypothetical protein [Halalkalicoccus subterraneus]